MLNVFLYVIFLNQRLKLVSLKEDSGEEPIILNTVVIIGKKKIALQEIRVHDTNLNTLPINYQSIREQGSTNEQLPRRYVFTGHFARGLSLFMTSLLNRPLSHEINKYNEIMTFLCMKSDHNVHSYRFQFV